MHSCVAKAGYKLIRFQKNKTLWEGIEKGGGDARVFDRSTYVIIFSF